MDIINCILNNLESFVNKIVYIGVECSQAIFSLLSEFSSLFFILNILKEF